MYNSPMHRKNRERKKYSSEERTKRKKERIDAKKAKRGNKKEEPPNPFHGLISFLKAIKGVIPNKKERKHERKNIAQDRS